jgi:hypothetical protein
MHFRYQFQVPGIAQQWRWGFFSGNGFNDSEQKEQMGGIQALWRDVLFSNQQKKMHVMVGGGDQIYCDDVWNLPAMLQVSERGVLQDKKRIDGVLSWTNMLSEGIVIIKILTSASLSIPQHF